MLRRFELTNYKNFRDTVIVDFSEVGGYQFNPECITNETIGKMLIYGRNATGKTNLGNAIMDITLPRFSLLRGNSANFLNADSDCKYATFNYLFRFDEDNVQYIYNKKSIGAIIYEKLILNGIVIFELDYDKVSFSFSELDKISAETVFLSRFLESITIGEQIDDNLPTQASFLYWLFANAAFSKDSVMLKLRDYIYRMAYYSVSNMSRNMHIQNDSFVQTLVDDDLKKFENFLNIMGVECELVNEILPDGQNEIYFKRKTLIPFFKAASSGTMVLYNLYRRVITRAKNLSFFYLDEFDAFYHYELSEKILNYLKSICPNCQIILTTHNTNLMTNRLVRPDCVFILSRSGTITALNKATSRELREGHNLEKLYMSGEFDD